MKIRVRKLLIMFAMLLLLVAGMELESELLYPPNDIVYNWRSFYKQERDSIDLLIVGSSRAFASFDADLMQEKLGKRVYILATNSQTVTQTYYNVKEALKYQKPEMILLEAFGIDGNSNWQNDSAEVFDRDWKKESNIDGMRLGLEKLEAIREQYTPKNWLYALFKIARCHQNWNDPSIIRGNYDFLRFHVYNYGCFRPSATQMTKKTMAKYEKRKKSSKEFTVCEENRKHFHMLAKLCRDHGIRLFVVMAPSYEGYTKKINYESRHQAVLELARSENLEFLDCNEGYRRIGLEASDFEDAYSTIQHLNAQGAAKVSRYVAERIPF